MIGADLLEPISIRSMEAGAPEASKQETDQEVLLRILKNPEMAALLKTLAQSL